MFVTPHGFGHASRACALMDELATVRLGLRFEIFTTVPEWFFSESLRPPFGLHLLDCDVGLVQLSAMHEDLPATLARLGQMFPLEGAGLARAARRVRDLGCCGVIADISPLGLAVAREAGLPSILVENFTWDWIYRGLLHRAPELSDFAEQIAAFQSTATARIQTTPVCAPVTGATQVGSLCRRPRQSRAETRRQLGLEDDARVALLSMGGVEATFEFATQLGAVPGHVIVMGDLRGGNVPSNVTTLPFSSSFYHPDLIHACDVVVGKLGYSTVAEAWSAGRGFAYVERPGFPESAVIARHVRDVMPHLALTEAQFKTGEWAPDVFRLMATHPRMPYQDGREPAAREILKILDEHSR